MFSFRPQKLLRGSWLFPFERDVEMQMQTIAFKCKYDTVYLTVGWIFE